MDQHGSETPAKGVSAPLALRDLTMGFGNGALDQLLFGMAEAESHGSMRATSGTEHPNLRGEQTQP